MKAKKLDIRFELRISDKTKVLSPCGAVVQLVRIPACHAGGRGFESRPLRHSFKKPESKDSGFFSSA